MELVIPPTNQLGSSVGEHPACIRKVPGSIPSLAYSFLFLQKSLWAEAFSTAMYVGNRSLTKALDGHTHYKMLYDVKPDHVNLHVFDAPCAIIRPSEGLKKHTWIVGSVPSISGMHVVHMHVHGGGLAKLANFKCISQLLLP